MNGLALTERRREGFKSNSPARHHKPVDRPFGRHAESERAKKSDNSRDFLTDAINLLQCMEAGRPL